MGLPGFTASKSLCTSDRRYRASCVVPEGRSRSAIGPQLRAGGGSADDCVDTYQNCYVDCSVRYPESADSQNNLNAMMREGCLDSCDAAYDLCSGTGAARLGGRIVGGIGRFAHVAAPIAQ
jgi:hypothetical protein